MSVRFARVNPRYFLNRLALEHCADSISVDVFDIVAQMCSQTSCSSMIEQLEDFCEAAVAPAFCWKPEPAALLAFVEELEKLIEAAFVLCNGSKSQRSPEGERFRNLFRSFSLPGWKRLLREWRQAAMSSSSIAELGDPNEMIPFVRGLEELINGMYEMFVALSAERGNVLS